MTAPKNKKFVVTTTLTFVNRYYVEAPDDETAANGVASGNLDHFSSGAVDEVVVAICRVSNFPPEQMINTNGAAYEYSKRTKDWIKHVRWDLAI